MTRALHRGFYQGWDLHPAQLPTRFAATFQFFRAGAADATPGWWRTAPPRTGAVADEPATARALADFLLRGLDCGALTDDEVGLGTGRTSRAASDAEEDRVMGIVLGPNRYGKAENRVVRIYRDTPATRSATSTSRRCCAATSPTRTSRATRRHVLPTDTQKNTAFAYAKEHGVTSPEDYALALGRRLLDACAPAEEALVRVEEQAWDRIPVDGQGHDHTFVRRGTETRTAEVVVGETTRCTSGPDRPGRCSSRPARSSRASCATSTPPSPTPTTGSWRRR